jgi:hypothetical protein
LRVSDLIGCRKPGFDQRIADAVVVVVSQGTERSRAVAGKGRAVHERQPARCQLRQPGDGQL